MINIGGGIALVKKTIFSYTASKGFFWTLAFGWMVPPMVFMYVWSRAAGVQGIGGYDAGHFITYYLALILINQFTYPSSHWTVGQAVLSGGYNHILLRPMPPIFEAISSDLALKLICLPFVILFVVVLGISQPAFTLALGEAPVWAIVASVSFAMILRFSFGYALALIAFFTERIDSLLSVNDTLVFLLAGQVAPVTLLPGSIGMIAKYLPYRYMLGFPAELITGALSIDQIRQGLIIQLSSSFLMVIICVVVWKQGVKRYTAVGG